MKIILKFDTIEISEEFIENLNEKEKGFNYIFSETADSISFYQ